MLVLPPLLCRCGGLHHHLTLLWPELHPGRQACLSIILHVERTAAEHLAGPAWPLRALAHCETFTSTAKLSRRTVTVATATIETATSTYAIVPVGVAIA